MARPLRVEFADAIYHLRSRGNARREIVADEVGGDRWVEPLQRSVGRHGWRGFANVSSVSAACSREEAAAESPRFAKVLTQLRESRSH